MLPCKNANAKAVINALLSVCVSAAPVFSTKDDGPYDANVTEGESFTVRCNATAKPAANLVWFQDGKELDRKS